VKPLLLLLRFRLLLKPGEYPGVVTGKGSSDAGAELINDLFLPWHPSAGVRNPAARLTQVRLIAAGRYAKNRAAYPVEKFYASHQLYKLQGAETPNNTKETNAALKAACMGYVSIM
jgi:hypothetical protein